MASQENIDSSIYWVNDAHKNTEAAVLTSRLNLDLARGEMRGSKSGLMCPVRRLVITSEDTPDKFALLFGPRWESSITEIHKSARMEVLLCPPPTSPAYLVAGAMDEGCPLRRPRGPSVEEEEALKRVRNLQNFIGRAMQETK